MADMSKEALAQVRAFVVELLVGNGTSEDEADKLADTLSQGRWAHDYPITVRTATELGLRVSTELPAEAREIHGFVPAASRTAAVGRVHPAAQWRRAGPWRQSGSRLRQPSIARFC